MSLCDYYSFGILFAFLSVKPKIKNYEKSINSISNVVDGSNFI